MDELRGDELRGDELRKRLGTGIAIPACPLPLNEKRQWSPRHQQALTHYYYAAGAGGLAVGVHSTQFEIREPQHQLLQPVLENVAHELDRLESNSTDAADFVRIAGVCGDTQQAIKEAELANGLGYHAGLLSMRAFKDRSHDELLEHCREVSNVIPIIGFYLQPAVGGAIYGFDFWRQFAEIENVVAIKVAPFNRYQTIEVARAVIESGRDDVSLYTGNDDNIILDLLTPFTGFVNGEKRIRFFDGGLLGQWGIWTRKAVEMLKEIKIVRQESMVALDWLESNQALTDANCAVFDAANQFAGCIPGIMEILRRNGLVPTNYCLNPNEVLSPGQAEELDRVTASYPHLVDDEFVAEKLENWLV